MCLIGIPSCLFGKPTPYLFQVQVNSNSMDISLSPQRCEKTSQTTNDYRCILNNTTNKQFFKVPYGQNETVTFIDKNKVAKVSNAGKVGWHRSPNEDPSCSVKKFDPTKSPIVLNIDCGQQKV